jgi:hypothetical protein
MPSEIKSTAAEEIRLRNHRAQLEQRNEMALREIEQSHAEDVRRTIENQAFQMDNLRRAYDVQISEEAEALEERLHRVRLNADERVAAEKKAGEAELEKLKSAHKQRLDEYRKNSEQQLEALRKQLQTSAETLHEKARKTAKREREVSGS